MKCTLSTMQSWVLMVVLLPVLAGAMFDIDLSNIRKELEQEQHGKNGARARELLEFFQMADKWTAWKKQYGKEYSVPEESYRRQIFFRNLKSIMEHNSRYPESVSYYMGLNQFSDLTLDEYRAIFNGTRTKKSQATRSDRVVKFKPADADAPPMPATVDWRTKGYVTPVRNQGHCNSGWAFSAAGSLEGQHFRWMRELLTLSEQQFIDCTIVYANQGCDFGVMDVAFAYLQNEHRGVETDADYPYIASLGSCHDDRSKGKVFVHGYVDTLPNETDLQEAVAAVGPVSAMIDSTHESFRHYSGGVYYEPRCGTGVIDLDHGVLVVGYGTHQGKDYWLVKNSFGTDWGMNGYIMMSRNRNNNCGILTSATYPIL